MRGRLYLSDVDEHRDNTGNYDQMIILDALSSFDSTIEYDRGIWFSMVRGDLVH